MANNRPNKSLELINCLGTMSKQKRNLLIWLICNIDDSNETIFTNEQVAECTGIPIGTTNRLMQQLIDSGLITKQRCVYLGELLQLTSRH